MTVYLYFIQILVNFVRKHFVINVLSTLRQIVAFYMLQNVFSKMNNVFINGE